MAINNPLIKNSSAQTSDPTGYLNNVIRTAISIFLIIGVLYFLMQLILAAFHMIASQGDSKKFEEARGSLTNSIIGLVIIFSVFALLKLIGTIFGISGLDVLRISWPSL